MRASLSLRVKSSCRRSSLRVLAAEVLDARLPSWLWISSCTFTRIFMLLIVCIRIFVWLLSYASLGTSEPIEWVGNPDLNATEIAAFSPRSLGTLLGFEFRLRTPGDIVVTHIGVYGAGHPDCRSIRFDLRDMTDKFIIGFVWAFENDGPGVFSSASVPVPLRINYRDAHSTFVLNAHFSNCEVRCPCFSPRMFFVKSWAHHTNMTPRACSETPGAFDVFIGRTPGAISKNLSRCMRSEKSTTKVLKMVNSNAAKILKIGVFEIWIWIYVRYLRTGEVHEVCCTLRTWVNWHSHATWSNLKWMKSAQVEKSEKKWMRYKTLYHNKLFQPRTPLLFALIGLLVVSGHQYLLASRISIRGIGTGRNDLRNFKASCSKFQKHYELSVISYRFVSFVRNNTVSYEKIQKFPKVL